MSPGRGIVSAMSCDWPVDEGCMAALPDLPDDPTPEQQEAHDAALARREGAIGLAVQVMWALSGRQFGLCETIARPCPAPRIGDSLWRGSPILIWDGSDWLNSGCGCVSRCRRIGPRMIHLPGPVVEVAEVEFAGQIVDPSRYRLEGDVLYLDREWPSQDLGRPLGEPGTWSVLYTRGRAVPPGIDRLTGLLAEEFDKACRGDGKCRLPRQVTAMSRQGVSYQMYDPTQFYAVGKTGLPEIDMWLASVNPNHIAQAPVVL
ncbi:head-tail adaptor [Gordonia phage Sour]|uniref:Head-to-tail adaptor n=1 Tax=Gordonia phage Sour TaxID=2182349 RepID=A0A2U8UKG1_9CAUD|nr:head-tail adaptor [Gordonia phage Sour]AWN04224.1 head-to-tail adaptor [Gordonia phage Sour]